MGITKYLEIECDGQHCSIEHFASCSIEEAECQAKEHGWLVINGKHFCTEECYQRYKENLNKGTANE